MHKIFLKDIVYIFSGEPPETKKSACLVLINPSLEQLKHYSTQPPGKYDCIHTCSANPDKLLADFESFFTVLEAAGGLVRNRKGEILFISRNGKWDLPKGKMEAGESRENTALREVEEECGISGLKLGKALCTTRHGYELKGKTLLKKTYWFEMQYAGDEKLVPQVEEGITKVIWAREENLPELLKNTYPSILEVLHHGGTAG